MMRIIPVLMLVLMLSGCDHRQLEEKDALRPLAPLIKTPELYTCYYTDVPPLIDGNISDVVWNEIPWTSPFVDIEGSLKPKPGLLTQVKMCWDAHKLYVAARLEEPQIWAYLSQQDDIVFHDNDFEVFIDPDNDARNYFELEINARGTRFDLFLPHPYRHSSFALHHWNFSSLSSAVQIQGSLNNGNDRDTSWTIELAIPFTDLSFGLDTLHPEEGKMWRINFSRVEWDATWNGNRYLRKTKADGSLAPEHNWVWSAVGEVSMHMPERYGYLYFSKQKPTLHPPDLKLPETEALKSLLWAVFYRQEAFFAHHHYYSKSLQELGKDLVELVSRKNCRVNLSTTTTQYEAILTQQGEKSRMNITQEGSPHILAP